MFDVLAQHVEAVPGVWDLVDGLSSRGVKMAVASNGPVKKMDITLARTGLLPKLAPHIYSGRDMQRSKPAPDVYLHAAAQLGVAAADCVVIEDSASGAKAAKAANMRCIGYAAHGIVTQLAPYCDQIAKDMGQVADHLGL
jgi:HAD superfamily hydrolase (TIGR01509 family)